MAEEGTTARPQPGWRKFPARYEGVLNLLVLSIMMTCIVSGISTVRSMGFTSHVFEVWPQAWAMSWCVAFPTLFIVTPLVRRIVSVLVEKA